MFYLFFTTPADNKRNRPPKQSGVKISRSRSIVTWILLITWAALIAFGAISVMEPEWLEEAAKMGKEGSSRVYKNYGDNFLRQQKYYRAIDQYKEAIKINPDYVGVLVNMAIAYAHIGDKDRGLKMLGDALKIENSKRGNIYYNLADILKSQGRVDDAIRYFEMAVGTEFDQGLIYSKLGPIYYATEQYEKARDAFENLLAIQIDPRTPYLNMLQEGMAIYENDTTHLEVITGLLAQKTAVEHLSNFDLESIRDARQHDREIAKTHNHLGAIYARMGVLEKAADHFRRSLVIWPGNRDAETNLQLIQQAIKSIEQTDISRQ
jgi:tetratricopeptide (TPR) repeat protein